MRLNNEYLEESAKEKTDKTQATTSNNDNLLLDNISLKKYLCVAQEKLGVVL